MSKETELIQFLFDGNVNPLSADLQRWINTSKRFTDFAERYREKIRKKLRVAGEMEKNLDVRGELGVEVARQRVVELPGDRHRPLTDVAPVRRRAEEPERSVVGAEAGEQQDRATVALVVPVAQAGRAVLSGG